MNSVYYADRFQLKTDEIQRLLKEQGLKHWWVAEFAGIHKTTLRRWLRHRIQRVHARRAAALAKVLGVELRQIVFR